MVEFEEFGSGPKKVIGLHGWFGDESCFKALQLSLDPAEHHCVWLAHRGYGRSRSITGKYSMEEMADDAIEVARSLGWTHFGVIGHSMGGKAAQVVAAKVPDRVRKLIAVTPVPAGPVPFDAATRALFEAATHEAGSRRMVIDVSTGSRLSPVWVDKMVRESMAQSTAEVSAAYLRSWAGDDLSGLVRGCPVETLVLAGMHDPTITPQLCELAIGGLFAHATIEALPNSGHYPMDEIPLALGVMVSRFLGDR